MKTIDANEMKKNKIIESIKRDNQRKETIRKLIYIITCTVILIFSTFFFFLFSSVGNGNEFFEDNKIEYFIIPFFLIIFTICFISFKNKGRNIKAQNELKDLLGKKIEMNIKKETNFKSAEK